MAQRVTTILVDDIDGGQADETIAFALDGVTYEIDLSTSNAATLRDALARFTAAGRRTGGRRTSTASRGNGKDRRADLATIRAWATANGHRVSDRGRVAQRVQDAYYAANLP